MLIDNYPQVRCVNTHGWSFLLSQGSKKRGWGKSVGKTLLCGLSDKDAYDPCLIIVFFLLSKVNCHIRTGF